MPTIRPITPADAADVAATVREGFSSYRAFAPAGWEPPAVDVEELRAGLSRPTVWGFAAVDADGGMAGHVAALPARDSRLADPDPGVVHLWQLFVRRAAWGSGIAGALLDRCVDEAVTRGFRTMRLFTPSEHRRARRFYEREGWTVRGEPQDAPPLGLPVVEYRRRL